MTAPAGFLGMRHRTAVAVGIAAATVGAAIGLMLPTPDPARCGFTTESEDGVVTVLPASCMTAEEMQERMAAIIAERPSARFGGR